MDYDYLSASVFEKGDQVIEFTEKLSRISETFDQKTEDISSNVKQKIATAGDSGSSSTFGAVTLLSLAVIIAGVVYLRVNRLHKKTHIL